MSRGRKSKYDRPIRETAAKHYHWGKITTYEGTYRAKRTKAEKERNPSASKAKEVRVKALAVLPKTKTFHTPLGIRKFKLDPRSITTTVRKVIIIMPTKTKKAKDADAGAKKRKKSVDEELEEELENLEDAEDEETTTDEEDEDTEDTDDDADEDTDDDDEDEDEEDVEPPKSKGKKKKAKKDKSGKGPGTRKGPRDGKVGSQEVAEHLGVDARTLRMLFRKHEIEKDEESGRYEWDSLDDPVIKKMKKAIEKGEHTAAKKETFDKLKEKGEAKKGKKKGKKKKKVEEDEDDE